MNRPERTAQTLRVVVIGGVGGTNVGESLRQAAPKIGVAVDLVDHAEAMRGPALLRRLAWRFAGRRPLRLGQFARDVAERAVASEANAVIGTGTAALTYQAIRELRAGGVRCLIFSTDDPWNPVHRAAWHLRALPYYDVVFTPRRANIADFRALGCRDVRYLPFAYDEELFEQRAPAPGPAASSDQVLFVGGADANRAEFFESVGRLGLEVTLVGTYWDRHPALRPASLGQLSPEATSNLTAGAAVNLCLVRRANRDGHVMRSFEIPAVGGFMLAEDTAEHRELFGEEGRAVLYFGTPEQAAEKSRWAIANPVERKRMAQAAQALVRTGGHTYRHRLAAMLGLPRDV